MTNSRGEKIKAACLAAGMATAWGAGQATANAEIVSTTVEASIPLSNAYLFYGTNDSGQFPLIQHVGDLAADAPTQIDYDNSGAPIIGYTLLATYDEGGEPGVVVSFAGDASGIIGTLTWADIFQDPSDGIFDFEESAIAAHLVAGTVESAGPPFDDPELLFQNYFDLPNMPYTATGPIATPIDSNATLVSFSTGAFVGTITIPEPAAAVVFTSVLLMLAGVRRRE